MNVGPRKRREGRRKGDLTNFINFLGVLNQITQETFYFELKTCSFEKKLLRKHKLFALHSGILVTYNRGKGDYCVIMYFLLTA